LKKNTQCKVCILQSPPNQCLINIAVY